MPLGILVPEEIAFAAEIPQANVGMPAAAIFLVIPLRHKGRRQSHLVTDFFHARLEEHGFVAGGERVIIAQVHLIHAGAVFAVVPLDKDAVVAHHTCNAAQQVFVSTRLADGVTVEAGIEWQQVRPVVFFTQRNHRLAEKAKFQFCRRRSFNAHRASALQHVIQDISRGNRHRVAVLSPQVANTGGDVLFPGDKREGGKIGLHKNIRKSVFPVTELEVGKDGLRDIPTKDHITLCKAFFE